jgi:alpha-L-fucosidase
MFFGERGVATGIEGQDMPKSPPRTALMTRRTLLKSAGAAAAAVWGAPHIRATPPAYDRTWDSLAHHPDAAWFNDGKFGIYFHWGIYSVPAFDNEWYSRNMYIEGQRAHQFHQLVYGPTSKFGYKDFLPMFRAEKFNAQEWAELIHRAGAKFAGPVTEHADGFSMWNSQVNKWNAAHMGPGRDIVGEMARALRSEGLKFVATFHHQWLWGWYPTLDKTVDCSNPEYEGLYGPPAEASPFNYAKTRNFAPPPAGFQENWEAKVKEVIDKYHPDLIYFDSRLNIIDEPRRLDLLAYYYNQAEQAGREVVLTYKDKDLEKGTATLDLERGRLSGLAPFKWMTDDAIDWDSWCNVQNPHYKSADRVVDQLVDIVSKNGSLLLDITPTADGIIPQPVEQRLRAIGAWLDVNGEAIYGTRPWKVFGEGPTQIKPGSFGEKATADFTAEDVRFTSRGRTLYAIVLDWPQNSSELVVKTLNTRDALVAKDEIAAISFLASDQKISWEHAPEGLKIKLPAQKVGDFAYAFKIDLK